MIHRGSNGSNCPHMDLAAAIALSNKKKGKGKGFTPGVGMRWELTFEINSLIFETYSK
jgi:hypothetical protein